MSIAKLIAGNEKFQAEVRAIAARVAAEAKRLIDEHEEKADG